MSNVWMKITEDDYELPLAVADSCKELAVICDTTVTSILTTMSRKKKREEKCKYIKVKVDKE